jgi:hypothetical protein
MKVNGMRQVGIGLAKFTSQESGNRTTMSGAVLPDSHARADDAIELFKKVRIDEQR